MENKLYKKLCPKKSAVTAAYITTVVVLLLILAVGLFFCYTAYAEGDYGAMFVCTAILMGMVALIGWIELKAIKDKKLLNVRKAQRLEGLTEADFEALEQEISSTEMRYKTFYLLKDHVYAPKVALLLRYEEIGQWKTIRHSTNYIPDSAWVELTDTSGCMQKIVVRQWRKYLMELEDFVGELENRKERAMEQLS